MKIGSMRGPKSFQLSGEFSDGCHHALSYTRRGVRVHASSTSHRRRAAGKKPDDLDFGGLGGVRGRRGLRRRRRRPPIDGRALRILDAHEQLERNGVDPDELAPIIEAIGAGDLAKGIELTSPELADKLSIAGTPDEVIAKIKSEIARHGRQPCDPAITDASLVKAFTGQTVEGVATVDEQLQLLADEVMPNFR